MSNLSAARILKTLKLHSSSHRAKVSKSFFKTGPGQYGEGDQFIGVDVPTTRKLAKRYLSIPEADLKELLKSPWHEVRLLAILILVQRYQAAVSLSEKQYWCTFFLKNRQGVNNWDLVDSSAYHILGDHSLLQNDLARMKKLLRSKRHWDRRLAMVATLAWIRASKEKVVFDFAAELLNDPEDLMHKAAGWMLREAGKRNPNDLRLFIKKNLKRMPRTMLRYSLEKFPLAERKKILSS